MLAGLRVAVAREEVVVDVVEAAAVAEVVVGVGVEDDAEVC